MNCVTCLGRRHAVSSVSIGSLPPRVGYLGRLRHETSLIARHGLFGSGPPFLLWQPCVRASSVESRTDVKGATVSAVDDRPDRDGEAIAESLSYGEDDQHGDVTTSHPTMQGNPGKPQHRYDVDDRDRSIDDPADGAAPL